MVQGIARAVPDREVARPNRAEGAMTRFSPVGRWPARLSLAGSAPARVSDRPVAQMERAAASCTAGRRFESTQTGRVFTLWQERPEPVFVRILATRSHVNGIRKLTHFRHLKIDPPACC